MTFPPADDYLAPGLYDFLSPPQAGDEIGRLGSYRVLKVLGAGGMGVVFQAEDPRLNRMVALKVMLPALAASGSNKERFIREARAAAAIEHDHIVAIFQVDEDRGVPFITMPLLRGEALEDRLKRQRKLPLPEALRIAKETAEGLAAAHERNMIHRDIKPANIWLEGEKGRVKILDFGLARRKSDNANLTQQGAILGTPSYMAPEQANGRKVDLRADLFSLACVLYRMTTGQLPFTGADAIATLIAVTTAQPRPPRQLNPDLPPALSRLILRLLAKDPINRPASAHEVIEELEDIAREPATAALLSGRASGEDDEPTLAEVLPARAARSRREVSPSGSPRRLWPWFAGVGGLAAVALVALVVLAVLLKRNASVTSRTPEVAGQTVPPETKRIAAGNNTPQPLAIDKPPPRRPPMENPPPGPGERDRAVAEWVVSMGGTVGVKPEDGRPTYNTNHRDFLPKGPFHLQQIFFRDNQRIKDDDLQRFNGLKNLDWILLVNTPITDAGLAHLKDVPKLYTVEIKQTPVTEAGIQKLRATFPRCNVRR